jgi:hypothetical protein
VQDAVIPFKISNLYALKYKGTRPRHSFLTVLCFHPASGAAVVQAKVVFTWLSFFGAVPASGTSL